ncbi:MAG: hypothetical protein ACI8PW_000311 [Methylophilaceae bacterium]
MALKIWVDADACPMVIKEILYRAAERAQVTTTLVANKLMRTPPSPHLRPIQVDAGFDAADNRIVQELTAGDLVITADIPLASQVIENNAHAFNPRGEFYSKENIREQLTMRNFMEELRASGVETSGPGMFSPADRKAFAAQLDHFLAKHTASVNSQ